MYEKSTGHNTCSKIKKKIQDTTLVTQEKLRDTTRVT